MAVRPGPECSKQTHNHPSKYTKSTIGVNIMRQLWPSVLSGSYSTKSVCDLLFDSMFEESPPTTHVIRAPVSVIGLWFQRVAFQRAFPRVTSSSLPQETNSLGLIRAALRYVPRSQHKKAPNCNRVLCYSLLYTLVIYAVVLNMPVVRICRYLLQPPDSMFLDRPEKCPART